MKILNLLINFLLQTFIKISKSLGWFIAAFFLIWNLAKRSFEKKTLDDELDSIRRLRQRRAKRDSDPITVVTDRLRADARKE